MILLNFLVIMVYFKVVATLSLGIIEERIPPPSTTTRKPHKFGGIDIKMIRTSCRNRVCEAMCHMSHFDGGTCFGSNFCHCFIQHYEDIYHGQKKPSVDTAIKKKGQKPPYMTILHKDFKKSKLQKGSLRLKYQPGKKCQNRHCERKCWILEYEMGQCAGTTVCYCFHDHLHFDSKN